MRENKAALHRGNDNSAKMSMYPRDTRIITYDVLLGVLGALAMFGIPFIMAVLKQVGIW